MIKLKCTECGSDLELHIGFTGADWDTEAGEHSGYGWPISLVCTNKTCALIYTIGHVKNLNDFSEVKNKCFKSYYYPEKSKSDEVIYLIPETFRPSEEEVSQAAQRLLDQTNKAKLTLVKKKEVIYPMGEE